MSGTEAGTATGATAATDGAATTTTTTAAGTDTATQAGATQAQPSVEQLKADVEKWKALSRKNEQEKKANAEAGAEQKKLLAEVAAKLGIATDGGTVDAAAITAQLETAQRQGKSAATELAVLRAAARLGADGDALLDSRQFMAQLEGLDGTEAIESAIRLALAQSPAKYGRTTQDSAGSATGTGAATATASASTAGEFSSGPGGARQWTAADVERASPAELTKAMSQGLLKSYLAS